MTNDHVVQTKSASVLKYDELVNSLRAANSACKNRD